MNYPNYPPYNGSSTSNTKQESDDVNKDGNKGNRVNMMPTAPYGYPPMAGYPPAGFPVGMPVVLPPGLQPIMPPGAQPGITPMPSGIPQTMPMGFSPHMMPMGLAVGPVPPVAVPMNPDTTGYFGNLSPNVSDEVLTAILSCSGGFKRLKRPVDPSTGKAKPFALVEYESVSDLSRAFRLLQDFVLDHRHLNIKLENNPVSSETIDQSEDLKCYEGMSRVLIGKKMTSGGSMEWLENKIRLKKQEAPAVSDRRDSRQRNYSDLIEEVGAPEASNSKGIKTNSTFETSLMSLKDRERRWEGKVRELERELQRDLERDEERAQRHSREAAELAEIVTKYSDECRNVIYGSLDDSSKNGSEVLFFSNREKWRKMREMAKEKEGKIFGECEAIKSEIAKISEESKGEEIMRKCREFIEKHLPLEFEELCAFPVDFGRVDEKFGEICVERTAAFFKNDEFGRKLGEIIYEKISKGTDAAGVKRDLAYEPTFLAVSEEPIEAEMLIVIIWRWLIYYTKFGGI